MKKSNSRKPLMKSKQIKSKPERTVGLDLGDRTCYYCLLDSEAELVEEGRIQTSEASLRKQFDNEARMRIALEVGTHSPWIAPLLESMGHEVIVGNSRKVRAISSNENKNDREDALLLGRLAAADPKLLHPLKHRSAQSQQDLGLIRARAAVVRARTLLANCLRGLVKSAGYRLPSCSTEALPEQARQHLPAELRPACLPLAEQIGKLNQTIAGMDKQVTKLGEKYPEIGVLRTVPGVGPLVAACYVLTLDQSSRIRDSRQAGAYLGLRPRQEQSGDSNPERGIAKNGNTYLRSLLVQAAHYTLGRFGPDSALRRWGLKLAGTSKRNKKRAVVAVARKLAVLLHRLWRSGHTFVPFPQPLTAAVPVA
jgi:transposase